MWSGPRSLSTALMYSFAQRADTHVIDEPFYAAYLKLTGLDHPMRDAVLQSQPTDPARVAADCLAPAPLPARLPVVYQKHMVHHMVPGVPLNWMRQVTNVFLIRHPARIIASYAAKRENPETDDLGIVATGALHDRLVAQGEAPVVVAAEDIRAAPEATLRALCAALGLDWDPAMLSWPAGPRPEDGVWAAHWYGSIHRSTGFQSAEGPLPDTPDALRLVLDAALPVWERLNEKRLRP